MPRPIRLSALPAPRSFTKVEAQEVTINCLGGSDIKLCPRSLPVTTSG
jgi:hypothetical protein